jgi:hypothetical protein
MYINVLARVPISNANYQPKLEVWKYCSHLCNYSSYRCGAINPVWQISNYYIMIAHAIKSSYMCYSLRAAVVEENESYLA